MPVSVAESAIEEIRQWGYQMQQENERSEDEVEKLNLGKTLWEEKCECGLSCGTGMQMVCKTCGHGLCGNCYTRILKGVEARNTTLYKI